MCLFCVNITNCILLNLTFHISRQVSSINRGYVYEKNNKCIY